MKAFNMQQESFYPFHEDVRKTINIGPVRKCA